MRLRPKPWGPKPPRQPEQPGRTKYGHQIRYSLYGLFSTTSTSESPLPHHTHSSLKLGRDLRSFTQEPHDRATPIRLSLARPTAPPLGSRVGPKTRFPRISHFP